MTLYVKNIFSELMVPLINTKKYVLNEHYPQMGMNVLTVRGKNKMNIQLY